MRLNRDGAPVLLLAIAGLSAIASSAPRNAQDETRRLLTQISPQRLEAAVRKRVRFHNRNTLSSHDDPQRGIGAAARWIEDEFLRCASLAGGRMKVERDEFMAPQSVRVPQPTKLVNVVATLAGTQAESLDRLFVCSAHYDSRATNALVNDESPGTTLTPGPSPAYETLLMQYCRRRERGAGVRVVGTQSFMSDAALASSTSLPRRPAPMTTAAASPPCSKWRECWRRRHSTRP